MREKKDEKQAPVLPFYEPHPPAWLPKVHHSGDLGYPGFHPARPCQGEDTLTLASVQDGLQYKPPISVEYFSYNKMINEKFMIAPDSLSILEGIMNDIFMRRADQIPAIPQSTFKIPTRVTLNDAKRQAWFADLANPDVPLHKLGKSVPHGAKGHDLLELLYSNNVAIPRAVWFLRVFGANETAGLRNKPNYVPTQYSVDMAILLTTYMRKQLAEITLPSAPRPGLNIKQIFKGVLADADGRERWVSRFSYCLHLLRTFYAEDLVDHRTFLTWLVNQMMNCNLAQAGFVIRLADEYLGDILASRALTRPLAESCLSKLLEIRMSCANEILSDTESLLKAILRRICHALPDTFVSPKLWLSNCTLLEEVLLGSPTFSDKYIDQNSNELKHGLFEIFLDIKGRNEAMMFKDLTAECSAQLVTAVSCVKLLNSISSDTDMNSVTYFDQDTQNLCDFNVKVDVLLTWSVTPLQYGDHRPLAAATLIQLWRNRACDRANRRDTTTPSHFLQDQLFNWLDTSEVAGENRNIGNVALLFESLVKNETFSYSSYIQRLVARAEPGLCMTDEDSSRHRSFLIWIPLANATASLINQRKVILYGARSRESLEENVERAIRREIRSLLPELFETSCQGNWVSASSLLDSCQTLTNASRFEQVRTFQNWLVPYFKTCLAKQQIRFESLLRTFLVSVELMAHTKCFHSLLELTLCMVERCNDVGSMNALVGTLCRYGTVWTCMDMMPMIVQALETAHLAWKLRGVPSRPLLMLLMKFDNGRYLSDLSRDKLVADIDAFIAALQPIVPCPDIVPDVLPEVLLLAGDPDENAASILANDLWMKYRTSHNWGLKVWDNTVASLRQIPSITEGSKGRLACALRYATFLWKVDQNLPNGLDADMLRWFHGAGKAEILGLNVDAWEVLTAVLLYLAVNSGLKTTTILEGLVYPAWHMGGVDNVVEPCLAAANSLCLDLLLREGGRNRVLPPTDFIEVQCLRTKRQDVFEEPHFPLLIAGLPALISLENNAKISEDLRLQCTSLRCRLCQDPGFRQGAYRKLDIIRDTFENSPFLMDQGTYSEDLSKREIAGLKVILYDSNEANTSLYDWPDAKSLLSPWKIAATTIQMQVNVKQLGRALRQVSMAEAASMNLNKLSSILLRHIKTADEAYYVGEMVRGADFNVATKFINNGLQCMSEILSQHTINIECLQQVGELLRVLVRVSEPFRTVPSSNPAVDPPVQQEFMQAILDKFKLLANCDDLRWKEALILARLLQFILNFKCTWSPGLQQLSADLLNVTFDLLLRCADADSVDLNLYPALLDTLLVVVDEMPHDPKLNFDPYRYYPNVSRDAITRDVPPEYRKQILTLLNDLPTESLVTNLIHSQRDSAGRMGFHQPVCNKPWEWIENIGEPSDSRELEREEKIRDRTAHLIKNASSIPLENFGARHTCDTVKALASEHLSRLESYSRGFEDGSSESVFIRDWRETRLELENELSPNSLVHFRHDIEPKVLIAKALDATQNTMETGLISQASSSKQQTQQSPIQGRFSNPSVLEQDAISETASITKFQQSGKRKASTTSSDDEMELIEGEVIPNATAKKQKASRIGKPIGKKK